MPKEKLLATSGILTGIVFLIMSIGAIQILLLVGNVVAALGTYLAAAGGSAGALMVQINSYLIMGWAFAIIALIAGIFWIITGIVTIAMKGKR